MSSSPALLAERGFLFDSSLMDADSPYELAVEGDTSLVEIPIQWALDDWEQYCFLPDVSGSGLIETPAKARELWQAEFEGLRSVGGCWVLTNHPFLSGRPSRAATLGELMAHVVSCQDVWTAALGEIATHVRSLELTPRTIDRPLLDDVTGEVGQGNRDAYIDVQDTPEQEQSGADLGGGADEGAGGQCHGNSWKR